jgi:uncharacterized protein YndB with AHSA1/START domain
MYANVTKVDDGHRIRYERHLKHPVEKVWGALTDPERLPAWLGRAEQLELVVGGPYEIHWENSDGVMDGTITELDPPRLLETDSISHGRLRWELEPQAGGCGLSLTVTMDAPDFLTKALAGWHMHIDVLESFLESGDRIDWEREDWMSDWERLHTRYIELYGAQAGTTG